MNFQSGMYNNYFFALKHLHNNHNYFKESIPIKAVLCGSFVSKNHFLTFPLSMHYVIKLYWHCISFDQRSNYCVTSLLDNTYTLLYTNAESSCLILVLVEQGKLLGNLSVFSSFTNALDI